MPWKLIGFVALLVFATFFIGFNLDHRCDVSIGFTTFKDVPIFLSLLISFVAGVLVMTPFAFFKPISTAKKKNLTKQQHTESAEQGSNKKQANTEPQKHTKKDSANK